jgi:hypothetical protein
VVYAKPPFGGPAQVLKYLARCTHRVAISNARLVEMHDGRVSSCYKDYADGHEQNVMTLSVVEFLRRYVQHVLPKGFVKIRHYGLLANRRRGGAPVRAWPGGSERGMLLPSARAATARITRHDDPRGKVENSFPRARRGG